MHGSMTIEAALGLPMLIFFCSHTCTSQGHGCTEDAAEYIEATAKDMSMAAYVAELSEDMLSDRLEDAGRADRIHI